MNLEYDGNNRRKRSAGTALRNNSLARIQMARKQAGRVEHAVHIDGVTGLDPVQTTMIYCALKQIFKPTTGM